MLDDSVLELGFRLLLLIAYCMRPLCRSPSRLAHACTAHWGLRGWRLEVQIEHMHPYNIPCNLYTDIYICPPTASPQICPVYLDFTRFSTCTQQIVLLCHVDQSSFWNGRWWHHKPDRCHELQDEVAIVFVFDLQLCYMAIVGGGDFMTLSLGVSGPTF